jgi:lysophospholipid acyltransferase (LPLAT)-like uncharacterized protein
MRINSYRFLTSGLFISFVYRFIRTYSWTFRLKVSNEKPWLSHYENGGTVLLCTWHQQFFPAIRYFQKYKIYHPSIMISQSRDGELVAGVANRSGWHTVRGSSTRGGRDAAKKMILRLKETRLGAHILDGPKGPIGEVKPGVILLALATDAVVVPIYVAAQKAWFFNSWDRFFIPKPFSRVEIKFGDMIQFERIKEEGIFEKQRKQLEDIMRPGLQ